MDARRWILPEGIEEILPEEAARIEALRRRLLDRFRAWGYELVIPPFVEHLETLLTGVGHALEPHTLKLTDPLSGRILGIRPDMTPQAARIEARRLRREGPVRLCYLGTVLRARPEWPGGTRSPLQVGAELYGHAGAEADLEVLLLMLETLAETGVREVHVDLGHVGIFRALARRAGLDAESEATLFEALQRKALPELRELIAGLEAGGEARALAAIEALAGLHGGPEVLEEARRALAGLGDEVEEALGRLMRLVEGLARHGRREPVHVDLAELRGYRYHTGVVFGAFVPGHGQDVARGGRYDDIGAAFGRARPATGFSADLRMLACLAEEAGTSGPAPAGGILAPFGDDPALLAEVRARRARGERVVWALPGQPDDPAACGCDRMLVREGGAWVVKEAGGTGGQGSSA